MYFLNKINFFNRIFVYCGKDFKFCGKTTKVKIWQGLMNFGDIQAPKNQYKLIKAI